MLAGFLILGGCNPGSGPVTSVPSAPAPKNLGKVVIVRLGSPAEPSQKDIVDGLKEEGLSEGTSYTIEAKDAGGDPSRLPSLVEEALQGAALVIAVSPEAAAAASTRVKDVPLVCFTGSFPPEPLGLVTTGDARPKATGAYSPARRSNLVAMATIHLPADRRRIGIVFDPADPVSVAVKDSLVVADSEVMTSPPSFELAEARAPGVAAAAVEDLVKRKVGLLIVVPGKAIDERALIEAATRAKLPVFGDTEAQARAGAILARTPNLRWGGFETGRRAGKVLKGADPRTLPFVAGAVFQTVINPEASKAIGVPVRGEFLRDVKKVP